MHRVFISAGEVSGDSHAAALVNALKSFVPDINLWGIGREKLRASGVNLVGFMEDYDIVGLDGIIKKGPSLFNLTKRIIAFSRGTSLAIFVDYPGYNILLARSFKKLGVKNVYYIAPQVWGWWRFRAKLVKRFFDLVLVIYPFEVEFWNSIGVNAIYVGNPVYDAVIKEKIEPLSIPEGKKVIGLLPGSRSSEVKRMLPHMLAVKKILEKKHKDLFFVLSIVPDNIHVPADDNMMIVRGKGRAVMKSSDALIVASGTATLEAALLEKPMVVLYELSPLSYIIGSVVKRVEYLSLVNIVSGKEVVKEFIQHIKETEVAVEVEKLLFDSEKIYTLKNEYRKIKGVLSGNAPYNAARLIKRRFFT